MDRYKDDTFHMLDTFNQTTKRTSLHDIPVQNLSKTDSLRGKTGNTWDAKHMTNFLSQSNYSNWSGANSINQQNRAVQGHRYSSSFDHFFRTTKDNKNVSRFGYTKMNPLVSLPEAKDHNCEVLKSYLQRQSSPRYVKPQAALRQEGKFTFEGNSVKYRVTDPLTLQYLPQIQPSQFDKQRLKWLISKRHPHGMTGIDHAQSPSKQFYDESGVEQIRIRQQPNDHKTHLINRDWKSKARVNEDYKEEYGLPKGHCILQRKFRNDNIHGYNIISNRTHK